MGNSLPVSDWLQIHESGQTRMEKTSFFPLSLVVALAKLFFLPWLHAAEPCAPPLPAPAKQLCLLQEDKRGNNCFSKVQIFKVCLSDSLLRQLPCNHFLHQPLGQSSRFQCPPNATTSPTRLHPSTVNYHPSPSTSPSIHHQEYLEHAERHAALVAQK